MSLVTGSGGAVVSRQDFDPWGAIRSGSISQTTLNYTGQRKDGTGLLYYHARYYDLGLGRFISADTIVPGSGALTLWPSDATAAPLFGQQNAPGPQNPQELNRYAYVQNNPLRYTDPDGHSRRPGPHCSCGGPGLGPNGWSHPGPLHASDGRGRSGWLGWLWGRLTGKAPSSSAVSPYQAALNGGRHAGLVKNYGTRSTKDIINAIKSYEKRAALHEEKLADPENFVKNWPNLRQEHQEAILRNWQYEVALYREQAMVLRGLLEARGE